MKFVLVLLTFTFLIAISTQSCQKDTTPPITDTLVISHVDTLYNSDTVYVKDPASIYGLWIGTYDVTKGNDAGIKGLYYSFELHTDNTIQKTGLGADGTTYYANGSWSLNGTSFSAHVVNTNLINAGVAQTITGTYDSTNSRLTGIVTDDLYSNYQEVFTLEKVR